MWNGGRGTGDGGLRMWNGGWGTADVERGTADVERGTADGGRETMDGVWGRGIGRDASSKLCS